MQEHNPHAKCYSVADSGKTDLPDENRSPTDSIEQDDLYQALDSARRRHVIRALSNGEPIEMRPLSVQLASVYNDCPPDDVTEEQRKREYISLHQSHLPKLDSWGIVDWNQDTRAVYPGPVHSVALEAMAAVSEPYDEPDSMLDRVRTYFRRLA